MRLVPNGQPLSPAPVDCAPVGSQQAFCVVVLQSGVVIISCVKCYIVLWPVKMLMFSEKVNVAMMLLVYLCRQGGVCAPDRLRLVPKDGELLVWI